MRQDAQFKPLWRIHNATYRKYVKGYTLERFARYFTKIRKILGIRG